MRERECVLVLLPVFQPFDDGVVGWIDEADPIMFDHFFLEQPTFEDEPVSLCIERFSHIDIRVRSNKLKPY